MKRYCCGTIILVLCFVFIIYSINFYFLSRLSISQNFKSNKSKSKSSQEIFDSSNHQRVKITDNSKLNVIYRVRNPKYILAREKLIKNFTPCNRTMSFEEIWKTVDSWSRETANEIYPAYSPVMCQALRALKEVPFVSTANYHKGTQLKLNLTVEGGKTIIFKPAWYYRNQVIDGIVYAGKDRHNSEIFAFYLSAVLNFRSTSLVVGRTINMKEVHDLANQDLRESFTVETNQTKFCVYGKCFYCNPSDPVCGDEKHYLEGAILYEIVGPLQQHKSPWQRTYKDGMKALWQDENNSDYCYNIKAKLSLTHLLDLIDASIFDFLIQNGDRHHYETRKKRLMLLDNGKGFGNFRTDFSDILAPLYQCCLVRKTTYARLLIFTGGALTEILKELTKYDSLYPILIDEHFHALERRLLKVFSMIEFCKTKFGNSIFH